MGYRSHGYLAFPTAFLGLYEKMCPKTPVDDWDNVTEHNGYTLLQFEDWKWYSSSQGPIGELELFMDRLGELYYNYEYGDDGRRGTVEGNNQRSQEDELIGQLPFKVMIKQYPWFLPILDSKGIGTINMWQPETYKPQEWTWGFNMQGEDLDDYEIKGHPEELGGYQEGSVDNMWGHDNGQAWKYHFKTAEDRDYFADNFNKIKAETDINMDIEINTKRFEIILHTDTTDSLWDQGQSRAGTDLSDPDKSFPLDNTQHDVNDFAFAVWTDQEIIRAQGDIHEMDIYEYRSARWSFNDYYYITLPAGYLEALSKEYESA